jgi:DNA primase
MNFDPSCIDVEDFLECLDVRNVQQATAEELRFSCPFPAHMLGDETPSAYMNIETTAFFCHSCHAKGNAIHFTCKALDISPMEAIRMLKQRYSPYGIDPDSRNMREEVLKIMARDPKPLPENPVLDETEILQFAVDWDSAHSAWLRDGEAFPACDYMFERGFTVEDLESWEFGYDEKSSRIVLPVRDERGVLVGFKARAWDGRKPKYLNLGGDQYGWPSFLKNSIVFGIDRAQEVSGHLIVVEGEFNVVAMHRHGYRNTVAINGSYFGPRQIRLLKHYADVVTLFFDSDPAGFDATRALSDELESFMPVYVTPDHDGDPADMDPDEISECLAQSISTTRLKLDKITASA